MRPALCLLFTVPFAACDDGAGNAAQEGEDAQIRVVADSGPDAAPPDAGCVPAEVELCNGVDDDCDERVDEGFLDLGQTCTLTEGACSSRGRNACAGDGRSIICDAPTPMPQDELCNGLDDDCDGNNDEGIDLEADPNNCARCGNVCDFEQGVGACDEAVCIMVGCEMGWGDANGIIADGCECEITNAGAEGCDMVDNDCDGAVDEGLNVGAPCVGDSGGCMVDGVIACGDDGAAICDHPAVMPAPEACDGRDNDCDGRVDEDFDGDGDGFAGGDCPPEFAVDCADDDPAINPGARDICEDGVDQNCDDRDAPCAGVSSWASRLAIAGANGAGCRDFTGDGVADNSFSGIGALGNGELQGAIDRGELNILPTTYGLAVGARDARFDLGILLGSFVQRATYRIRPDSYDQDGDPQALFVNAELADGQLTAGPGDFPLQLPFPGGPNLQLDVQDAVITGGMSLDEAGLSIRNGWITGVVPEQSLQAALVVLPPEIAQLVPLVLQADVDRDGDGEPDGYSACIEATADPATILE